MTKVTSVRGSLIKKLEKDYKCKIKINSRLSIGDKDWLTYEYDLSVKFLGEFLPTEKNSKIAIKLIRSLLS